MPLTKVNAPLSLACVAPPSGVKLPAAIPVTYVRYDCLMPQVNS